MTNNKLPKFISNPKESTNRLVSGLKSDILNKAQATAYEIQKQDDDIQVTRRNNSIQIQKILQDNGMVDLKPYFARSSKRKKSKNGGWYLTIPIRVKTSQMTSKMYNHLRKVKTPKKYNQTKTIVDYINATRQQSSVEVLKPPQNSENITKIRQKNNRSTYVYFRTVSSNSDPRSWIINRGNTKNMSSNEAEEISRLMNWEMQRFN